MAEARVKVGTYANAVKLGPNKPAVNSNHTACPLQTSQSLTAENTSATQQTIPSFSIDSASFDTFTENVILLINQTMGPNPGRDVLIRTLATMAKSFIIPAQINRQVEPSLALPSISTLNQPSHASKP